MPKKTAETDAKPMTQRIHQAYSQLPDGERRVADAILGNPSDLALYTASELSGFVGVSNATVSRFFRHIGYANFDEARQDARRMRSTGSPLFAGGVGRDPKDTFADLAAQEASVIEATLSRINPLTMKEIGRALASSRRIRTLGYRNSHFLAEYLTAQLSQLRDGVSPLSPPGQTRAEGLSALGPGDLAIVIGLRRRTSDFADTVDAIAGRGADILLLADQTIRETPALATWTLDCVVNTPQYVDSYVGAFSVLRLLVLEAAHALGPKGQAYLEQVEAMRDALGELE